MKSLLKKLHKDEQGADLLEYILILALIALPVVALVLFFKSEITTWFMNLFNDYKDSGSDGVE
ncbi:MAG: Flp family type IVb pilin [Phycisphaerales bacterium]|jgi:Flp pilus assembly pilin Flp|nr:Flp family type IVb pilin [Phycisphaerales bacterium]MBT7171235.1 Flp family type IVb pilin [Phycisphaerales bacterium]